MTDQHFALFDTRIGLCAIAWGPRGINGTQLPMGGEQKIRTRIQQQFDKLCIGNLYCLGQGTGPVAIYRIGIRPAL